MKSAFRIKVADSYYTRFETVKRLYKAMKFYFYNGFITKFPSYRVRTFYLRHELNIKIGKKTAIHMGCYFAGDKIIIGNNSVIARDCYIDGRVGLIEIGDNVSLGLKTSIISLTHDLNSPTFDLVAKPVCIQDYSWIGMGAMILPGVTLEKGAVVGAGSVVTKDVPPLTVVAGVPAKIIGTRNKDLNYTLSYFPFFNTDI